MQDLVQRLNKARLWSLDHLPEYARNTAELTKLPEDVLALAPTRRSGPARSSVDESIVKGGSGKPLTVPPGMASFPGALDVSKADRSRSFTAASAGSN